MIQALANWEDLKSKIIQGKNYLLLTKSFWIPQENKAKLHALT